jgi:hypothetical protein
MFRVFGLTGLAEPVKADTAPPGDVRNIKLAVAALTSSRLWRRRGRLQSHKYCSILDATASVKLF